MPLTQNGCMAKDSVRSERISAPIYLSRSIFIPCALRQNGVTPFHLAAGSGNVAALKMMIDVNRGKEALGTKDKVCSTCQPGPLGTR